MASLRKKIVDDDDYIQDDRGSNAELATIRAERDEYQRALAAEQDHRRRAETQLTETDRVARDSSKRVLESEIARAKIEADRIEADIQAAFESADGAKLASLNRTMAVSGARLLDLERQKAEMDRAVPARQQQQEDAPQGYRGADAEFEGKIANLSPRSKAWLRTHKDAMDKEKELIRAHHAAIGEGHDADTDAYFASLETRLGYRTASETSQRKTADQPASRKLVSTASDDDVNVVADEIDPAVDVEDAESPAKKPEEDRRRRVATAAPSTREALGSTTQPRGRITLTKAQLKTAEALGMTPREYHDNLPKGQRR